MRQFLPVLVAILTNGDCFSPISHRRVEPGLSDDVPTAYKPFSVAALREAVRKLLNG